MNKEEIDVNALLKRANIELIIKYIDKILDYKELYKLNEIQDIINRLIESKKEKIIFNNFSKFMNACLNEDALFLIEKVSEFKNGKKVLENNMNSIFEKLNGEDLLEALSFCSTKIQKKIAQNNRFSYNLHKKDLISENTLGCIIKSNMNSFVEALIKEVSNGKRIYKLDSGTYSDVIKTNGFVIKLGETREKYKIPYHPNILQPLLREKIEDKNGRIIFVAEVQPIVDTKNITEEHIKYIKEKFQKDRIKFSDLDCSNIGLLNEPNKRHLFNGIGGITDSPNIKTKTLPKGTPVVLDTDLLERY